MINSAPQNPAGEFEPEPHYGEPRKLELIGEIESAPRHLRELVDPLQEADLDIKYRNWTIRQIVNHIADSHVNSYVRFKWALTEDKPTIKPYDESLWSGLLDANSGSIQPALVLLEGLHAKWSAVLKTMTDEQFDRAFFHPELDCLVTLREALPSYAWHGRHHTAQIKWIIDNLIQ